MGCSIPIFRVAGIQLRIHITFLLLIGWIAFVYYAQGGSPAAVGGVLLVLLLFACVVLHEFGHALAGIGFALLFVRRWLHLSAMFLAGVFSMLVIAGVVVAMR